MAPLRGFHGPAVLLFLFSAGTLRSQTMPARIEAFGSFAWARVFRIEDESYGNKPNIGGGIGTFHSSGFGLEFETNHTLDLEPKPVPCAISGVACIGSANAGVKSVTLLSANAVYRFGRQIQPFLTGGFGGLWSKTVTGIIRVQGNQAVLIEQHNSSTALALNFGGGLIVPIGERLYIRGDFRYYNGTLPSSANLSVMRVAVGIGYRW